MKKSGVFFIMICCVYVNGLTQTITQTVRGHVVDQLTKQPLYGANVLIENTMLGAATDASGLFRVERVPLGRQTVKVMYMGYKTSVIPELLVGSAKEVILEIALEEDVIQTQAIVATPDIEKSRSLNTMSTVSARSFSVEETQRYAGGLDDPARLASSFAGVTTGSLQDNAIVIRGNAPKGLQWRLEGVEIPNPNHFPDGNVIGGGFVTIFSNQLLTNSDFFTGAFPAEYGNAMSGVFDMKMRNGNNERREMTFQSGVIGIDFAAEGPFRRGGSASYLMNYRYSTLGLLVDAGIIKTEQKPGYQDLSFKFNFPTKRYGTFSLWGIAGYDRNNEPQNPDSTQWTEDWDRVEYEMRMGVGVAGFNHRYILGEKIYINSTLAATLNNSYYDQHRLDDHLILRNNEFADSKDGKVILKTDISHKFGKWHNNKTGLILNHLFYDIVMRSTENEDDPESYQTYVNDSGSSQHIQAYTQSQFSIGSGFQLNTGIHYEYFALNGNQAVEPRFGLTWQMNPVQSISLGFGKHSQLELLRTYVAVKEGKQPNKNLDFTDAYHYVLAYDRQITEDMRIKIEPYYQYLFNVPVIDGTSYSLLNLKGGLYFNDALVNEGRGKNYGVDLTIEKFLSKGYYYLLTASVFESKYKGGDGIWRDTRFNRHFVVNALFGKEWKIGETNLLSLNGGFSMMGGEREAPVLIPQSLASEDVVLDESRNFEASLTGKNILDLTVNYRINKRSHAHVWSLQIKNATGTKISQGYIYDMKEKRVIEDLQVIIVPTLNYKIEF